MNTPTPSVNASQQAMLVSLSFNLCRQSVQLKDESRKVEQEAGAQSGTVRSSAFYFQRVAGKNIDDGLAKLKSYMNEWRMQHNRLTRMWDNNSTRLLPAKLVTQYMEMSEKYKAGIGELINEFINDIYPSWFASGPERMGNLYAKSKFPTLEEVSKSIGFDLAYMPLPDADAFKRIAVIAPDQAELMEKVTNERVQKAVAEAQAQTWNDVLKPIQHVVDTLSKDKAKIYDTLIGNVLDIVDLVPSFNLSNDPKLAELAATAKAELGKVSTEDLRKSDKVRKETLKTATTLINSFAPFARKFGE